MVAVFIVAILYRPVYPIANVISTVSPFLPFGHFLDGFRIVTTLSVSVVASYVL